MACSNGPPAGGTGGGGASGGTAGAGASGAAGGGASGGTAGAGRGGAAAGGGAGGSGAQGSDGGSSGGSAGSSSNGNDAGASGGAAGAGGASADAGTGGASGAGATDGGGDASGTTDPFDPASCPGPALTAAQAARFFQPGAVQAVIGSYTIEMRQRSCNTVTGCGSWGAPTTEIGSVLGGGTRPLSGTILLNVQGSDILLALQDATEEKPYSMGASCSAVNGTPETCGAYEYDLGDQWGGSGGLFPTMVSLIDVADANVLFSGVLTKTCLRLAYSAVDSAGNDVQQFVLLAPVSAGAPLPPDPCPGGGTQMACGSQAPGQTTCCQNGLTTCPQSGCDCWGACQ